MRTQVPLPRAQRSVTRRWFLRAAAAAAAAPLFLPASARGANDRITFGCIGVGGRGTGNMQAFLPFDQAQVVAVCDVQEGRRNHARQIVESHYASRAEKGTFKGCKAYNDFREVVARDDIDAVTVCTQDHWHAIIAIAAMRAGKDVYCEKPLGVAVAEGQAMRDAVRRYGRVFQTGTQQRSERNFRFACELARNGYVGKIHTVKVAVPAGGKAGVYPPVPPPPGFDWEMWLGPAPFKPYDEKRWTYPTFYYISDYCVGFICNWGVHHLDIAHWGCPAVWGEPFEIEGKAEFPDEGICDNAMTWQTDYTYPSGLKMSFSSAGNPNKMGCVFEGDKGWVHVDRSGIWAEPASLLSTAIKPNETRLYESRHHHGDLLECVRTRRDPVAPVEAGYIASTLGILSDIAVRLGRKVKWDPAKERFINDDDANRMLTRPMRGPWVL